MFLLLGISVFLKKWFSFPRLETVQKSTKNYFFFKNTVFCVVLDHFQKNPFENTRFKFEKKCTFSKLQFSFKAIYLYKTVFTKRPFWSIYLSELSQNSTKNAESWIFWKSSFLIWNVHLVGGSLRFLAK